jgi:hypothetical protein
MGRELLKKTLQKPAFGAASKAPKAGETASFASKTYPLFRQAVKNGAGMVSSKVSPKVFSFPALIRAAASGSPPRFLPGYQKLNLIELTLMRYRFIEPRYDRS